MPFALLTEYPAEKCEAAHSRVIFLACRDIDAAYPTLRPERAIRRALEHQVGGASNVEFRYHASSGCWIRGPPRINDEVLGPPVAPLGPRRCSPGIKFAVAGCRGTGKSLRQHRPNRQCPQGRSSRA